MKETNENIKKLFIEFNNKHFSFYNPNNIKKKRVHKNIFLEGHKRQIIKKSSSLLLGNRRSNQLIFTARLVRIEKYNPKEMIKNKFFKVNSLDKNNINYQLLNNKEYKCRTINSKNNSFYKVSRRIQGSFSPEHEKKNYTLLNSLDKNNLYYNSCLYNTFRNKKRIEGKKREVTNYKSSETRTYNSTTDKIYECDLPIIQKYIKDNIL